MNKFSLNLWEICFSHIHIYICVFSKYLLSTYFVIGHEYWDREIIKTCFLTSNAYDFKRKYGIVQFLEPICDKSLLKSIPLWLCIYTVHEHPWTWQHTARVCSVWLPPLGVKVQCWKWAKCSNGLIGPLSNWKMHRKSNKRLILHCYRVQYFSFLYPTFQFALCVCLLSHTGIYHTWVCYHSSQRKTNETSQLRSPMQLCVTFWLEDNM